MRFTTVLTDKWEGTGGSTTCWRRTTAYVRKKCLQHHLKNITLIRIEPQYSIVTIIEFIQHWFSYKAPLQFGFFQFWLWNSWYIFWLLNNSQFYLQLKRVRFENFENSPLNNNIKITEQKCLRLDLCSTLTSRSFVNPIRTGQILVIVVTRVSWTLSSGRRQIRAKHGNKFTTYGLKTTTSRP